MLLFITGSYPACQDGIADGAKVLLDAMIKHIKNDEVVLLTTDIPDIQDYIKNNGKIKTEYLKNWKIKIANISKFLKIIVDYNITVIHMEYPGIYYGKTFLASFLPLIIKLFNLFNKNKITFNIRLHEFTKARFLRKVAILPLILFADKLYIPSLYDRKAIAKIGRKKIKPTIIGTNIGTYPIVRLNMDKIVISYFGGIYHGKGIKRMFRIWKRLKDMNSNTKYMFKIIGEFDPNRNNHFVQYHKQAWKWLEENDLIDDVIITGYLTDNEVSYEIQNSDIAMLLYEDGLTLRRGSFIAYLAHGIPIITTMGDEEAKLLLKDAKGVLMAQTDDEIVNCINEWSNYDCIQKKIISSENIEISKYFSWDNIAVSFLKDYKLI